MSDWTVAPSNNDDDEDDGRKKKKAAKKVPRRSVLKTAGITAGGLLGLTVAGAGVQIYRTGALKSFTDGPGFDSIRAWQAQIQGAKPNPPKTEFTGNAKGLILAGLLAASPHNTQPWSFSVRDNIIDLVADESRNLGVIDSRQREMLMGLGCCIENMVLGASAVGLRPLLNMLPDGPDSKVIARFTLYEGVGAVSKEAAALADRHTNRGPYVLGRQVEPALVKSMESLVSSANTNLLWLKAETDAGRRFAEGTVKATADFIADKEMTAASEKWFRFGPGLHRDGLTLPTVGVPPWMVRVAMALPKSLMGNPHQEWLEMTRVVHVATAPMFGLIVVPALNDRIAVIEAGRLWQRLHIQATLSGLAVQPMNQLLEMADRDAAMQRESAAAKTLGSLAAIDSGTIAFAFRMGYSRFITNPSPRRGLGEVISS